MIRRERPNSRLAGSRKVPLECCLSSSVVQCRSEFIDIEADRLRDCHLLVTVVDVTDLCGVHLTKTAQIPMCEFGVLLPCGGEGLACGIRRLWWIGFEDLRIDGHSVVSRRFLPMRGNVTGLCYVVGRVVELVEVFYQATHDVSELYVVAEYGPETANDWFRSPAPRAHWVGELGYRRPLARCVRRRHMNGHTPFGDIFQAKYNKPGLVRETGVCPCCR